MRKQKIMEDTIKKKKLTPTRFVNLPPELHAKILSSLDITEIKPLLFASRKCNTIVTNNYLLWKSFHDFCIKSEFIFFRSPLAFINRLRQRYLNHTYIRRGVKEMRNEVETGQTDITKMLYDSKTDIVYTASDDNSIKAMNNSGVAAVFAGHGGGIWTFKLHDKYIVSGSIDKKIKIWDRQNVICLQSLAGHRSTIRCLEIDDEHIVSGSRDADIRVWDYNGNCLHVLQEHTESVRCIDTHKNLLVSGSYDGGVILWDYKKGTKLANLKTHSARVYTVKITDEYIASSGQCCYIYVSDLQGTLKYTLKEHRSIVAWIDIIDHTLISSGADGMCIAWDLKTGTKLFSIVEKHHITAMKYHNDLLLICTNNTANLYSFKTGNFVRNILNSKILIYDAVFEDNKIIIASKNTHNKTEITRIVYKKI